MVGGEAEAEEGEKQGDESGMESSENYKRDRRTGTITCRSKRRKEKLSEAPGGGPRLEHNNRVWRISTSRFYHTQNEKRGRFLSARICFENKGIKRTNKNRGGSLIQIGDSKPIFHF